MSSPRAKRGHSVAGSSSPHSPQQKPRTKHTVSREHLLANVQAADLRLLGSGFSGGLAEAFVVIRSRRMSLKSSQIVKGAMFHFAGSNVSDWKDTYYLLRVSVPANDPGGALLFVMRVKLMGTGELILQGVEMMIPVRGIVGVAAFSVADADPVKHFRFARTSQGASRPLASFVQGQVALDISVDAAMAEQHLAKEPLSEHVRAARSCRDLPLGQLILCFESMDERNVWLDFLTDLLMNVETADLRLEELKTRRRNKTIGPAGVALDAMSILGPSGSDGRLPLGPPPSATAVASDVVAHYRMFHFGQDDSSGAGGGAASTGPSGPSLSSPPTEGQIECKLKGEAAATKRKVTAREMGVVQIEGLAQPIDLTKALVQATTPNSRPFHILKVPHDAQSAMEERAAGGPVKLVEFVAESPEQRAKWIDWLVFVRGNPQAEEDTYTYREAEGKAAGAAGGGARSLQALGSVASIESAGHEPHVGTGAPGESVQHTVGGVSMSSGASRSLKRGGAAGASSGAVSSTGLGSDKSSLTSVGSHVHQRSRTFSQASGRTAGGATAPAIHDPWRDFTWGYDDGEVQDPREVPGLLYDENIDWSLPQGMRPMPVPYSPEEAMRLERKREELSAAQRMARQRPEFDPYAQSANSFKTSGEQQKQLQSQHQDQQQQYFGGGGGGGGGDAAFDAGAHARMQAQSVPQYQVPASAATEFVTRGVWGYVQLSADGMPPMVDEAAFSMRYFFATFGGCAPEQRAQHGTLLVLYGTELDRVWFSCAIEDIIGVQIGSRCAGALSFVVRIRDQRSGSVLNLTVVCASVFDRFMTVQFLMRAGGIDQLPATLISDVRDGAAVGFCGSAAAGDGSGGMMGEESRTHSSGMPFSSTSNTAPPSPSAMNQNRQHSLENADEQNISTRGGSLFFGRAASKRPVATGRSVLDVIDEYVRGGGSPARAAEQEQRDRSMQLDQRYRHDSASDSFNNIHQRQTSHQHHRSVSSNSTPSPSSLGTAPYRQRPRGESYVSDAGTTVSSSGDENSHHSGADPYYQQQQQQQQRMSPSRAAAIEDTALLAAADPTCCQLCGTPNKSECPLCDATGLFHPEYLTARAVERQLGGDGAATSVLHFLPPQAAAPRVDVVEPFRRYHEACKLDPQLAPHVEYRRQCEKLCGAVVERYEREVTELLEEADILLFGFGLNDNGPVHVQSQLTAN